MARVNSALAGKLRGRVGSTVFRNGQRNTVAAQYNPQVANPKTAAQAVQRAAFATATTAQSALLNIVDHSHEKLASRRENLQRFVQQNTELVRAGILADYNGAGSDIRPVLKGAKVIVPNPYVISEGSLLFPRTQWVSEGSSVGFPLLGTIPETISTKEQYAEALAAFGLLPGDQISLVAIVRDPNMVVASFTTDEGDFNIYACEVVRARITFKPSLPEGFSGSLFANSVFNPALVAKREGQMLAEVTQVAGANWLGIETPIADGRQYELAAGVLIRSQESGTRVAYSNGRMITTSESDYNVAWPMAKSYMEGASVRLGDQPFLDNPLQAVTTSQMESELIDVENLPAIISDTNQTTIEIPLPTAPTSVVLNAQASAGAVQQTANAVKPESASLASWEQTPSYAATSLNIGDENGYATGVYTLSLLSSSGRPIIIYGGYAIANGKRYSF